MAGTCLAVRVCHVERETRRRAAPRRLPACSGGRGRRPPTQVRPAPPLRPCHELFQMCRRVVMRREHAPAGQGDSLKVRGRPYTDPRAVADLTFLVPADHKTIILYR